MKINPNDRNSKVFSNFQHSIEKYVRKSDLGLLTRKDMTKLNVKVNALRSEILSPKNKENSAIKQLSPEKKAILVKDIDAKMTSIIETNLAIQKQKLTASVKTGKISNSDLRDTLLPFGDKLALFLAHAPRNSEGNPEISFTDVPDKRGALTGELRLIIKEDPILDKDGLVLSQINEPIYREALVGHRGQRHYNFEFYDSGRIPEIKQKLGELEKEKNVMAVVEEVLQNYFVDFEEDEFNTQFTMEQRDLFEIPHDKILNGDEIVALYEKHQERSFLLPAKEDSVKTELAKATIRGRFCVDGSIGELKSVNIHSEGLGGKELMDVWDNFCGYMQPSQVYLEDDAKIEGSTGSYNLRLFRLLALPDKASWYMDNYSYHPYERGGEGKIEDVPNSRTAALTAIAPFKEMTLNEVIARLKSEGMKPEKDVVEAVTELIQNPVYGGGITLGELVKHLGNRIRGGEPLHKTINSLLDVITTFSKYSGEGDAKLLNLKQAALEIANGRFYRKSYS